MLLILLILLVQVRGQRLSFLSAEGDTTQNNRRTPECLLVPVFVTLCVEILCIIVPLPLGHLGCSPSGAFTQTQQE